MFIAYVTQASDGCDYSIACGETIWTLKAKTREEAIKELKREIIGDWDEEDLEWEDGSWDGDKLEWVMLFEVVGRGERIEVEEWYSAARDFREECRADAVDEKERAEFERLKTKYGKRGRRK